MTATTLAFAAPDGESFDSGTHNETRSCSEIADGARQLRVRMLETGMSPVVTLLARTEVDAIWRQYGIDIVWEGQWTPDRAKPDLWVQFVDYALRSKNVNGAPAIAWIPFGAGRPLPYVRVSKPNATALLKAPSWFDGRPLTSATEQLQMQAMGRIIGRALAHEIGHFLLEESNHAKQGLMRAALDPERMVNPGTEEFQLQASDVRALRAVRIASCEVALRH